eukprot:COSAG02_NODE_37927_length_435_cov_1.494048_1_plen_43_part_10
MTKMLAMALLWYTKSHSILNPDSCPLRIYGIHIESVEFRDCSN